LAEFLAIHQSDAALLGCVLRRLAGKVSLGNAERAAGVGFFQSDDVLVRKRPLGGVPALPEKLAEGVESEAALICSGAVGTSARAFNEQTTLPFRFKRWLFAVAGQPDSLAPIRPTLLKSLPDYLRRSVKGDSAAEGLFFTFLSRLRDVGRLDDHELDAESAARALAAAVGEAEPDDQRRDRAIRPVDAPGRIGREVERFELFCVREKLADVERQARGNGRRALTRLLESFDPPDERADAALGLGWRSWRWRLRLRCRHRLLGLRQHEVVDAEAREQAAGGRGHVAAMAQKPSRRHRQLGDQLKPFVLAQPCGSHRRGGRLRLAFCEVSDKAPVAQPQARLAQDPRLLAARKRVHDLAQPIVGSRHQWAVRFGRDAAEQVQQLPELRARSPLARGAGAQDGGKAVVELQSVLRQ